MLSKKLLVFSTLFATQFCFAQDYCAAVRGNGQNVPGHWASLSKVVENRGMPKTMAGGSSGSVTMFLLDGLYNNDYLTSLTEEEKKNQYSLLIKSFVPHVKYFFMEDVKVPEIMKLAGSFTGKGDKSKKGFMGKLKLAMKVAKTYKKFMKILGEHGSFLNPELIKTMRADFKLGKKLIEENIATIGKFDAKTDKNLFFREGLVDFKHLAIVLGRISDYYAGNGDSKVNAKLEQFLQTCSSDTKGKEWDQIISDKPACEKLFHESLNAYYSVPKYTKYRMVGKKRVSYQVEGSRKFPNKMLFQKVGSGIGAIPSTAVILGESAKKAREITKEFYASSGENLTKLRVNKETDLKFGYWGNNTDLNNIVENIETTFPNDLKSKMFHPIKNGIWFEVLSTSPAEPGLASLQRIPDGRSLDRASVINKPYFKKILKFIPTLRPISWMNEYDNQSGVIPFREEMYSAGGWSDLHPTLVLRASGCDDVLYITNQNGDAVFGQRIYLRLSGEEEVLSFWDNLDVNNRIGWTGLSAEEKNTNWNQLYNIANSNSSFNLSVREADAVYCTNWNEFNVAKGEELAALITDAYNAPIMLNNEYKVNDYLFGINNPASSVDNFPGCIAR